MKGTSIKIEEEPYRSAEYLESVNLDEDIVAGRIRMCDLFWHNEVLWRGRKAFARRDA